MKKLILIVLGIVAFFWLLGKFKSGSTNVIDDERTYQYRWRQATSEELVSIGQLMVNHNISGCGEYQVKEVDNSEFVIACTSDGTDWKYYVAWPRIDEIKLASDEMERKLAPPY